MKMEMTQKQIEIEAQNYLNGLDLPENADKQLILESFKNGMAWMLMLLKEDKQQWIDKACKWWENEFTYPTMAQAEINWYQTKIAEFKKAMKGE